MKKTQKPKPKTKKGKSGSSTSSKTNSKGAAERRPHITLGKKITTQPLRTPIVQADLARRKIWMSEDGSTTNYEHLDKGHLDNINDMLQEGRASNRKAHKDSIKQEKLRRESKAGEVLYGEKKKGK